MCYMNRYEPLQVEFSSYFMAFHIARISSQNCVCVCVFVVVVVVARERVNGGRGVRAMHMNYGV